MLEERLGLDPSRTQTYTTALLTTHGFIGLISAPIVAHLAEKTSSQKKPLLIALAGCFIGTLMIALAPSGMNTSSLEDNPFETNRREQSGSSSLAASCNLRQVPALGWLDLLYWQTM
jgi:MFS family permease